MGAVPDAGVCRGAHAGIGAGYGARANAPHAPGARRRPLSHIPVGVINERYGGSTSRAGSFVHTQPRRGGPMADNTDNMVLYTAVYGDVDSALDDLNALEQLHEDQIVGKYDAAVIDTENGKPHIVKRMDRPRIRVIPEAFGSGTLSRKALKDAASELTSNEAGLVVAGEP